MGVPLNIAGSAAPSVTGYANSPATPAGLDTTGAPKAAAVVSKPKASVTAAPLYVQQQGVGAIYNWYAKEQARVNLINNPPTSSAQKVEEQSTDPMQILATLKSLKAGASGSDAPMLSLSTGGTTGSTGGASGNLQVLGILLSLAGLAAFFLFRK